MARFLRIVVAGLLAVDLVVIAGSGWVVGWWIPLTVTSATGILGLFVIGYASWRYGDAIAIRLNGDDALDGGLVAGPMLLLAGVLLLLPGLSTDLAGLALLIPEVQRRAVRALRRRLAGDEASSPAVLPAGAMKTGT
jgi:UPF0716 protein FxsA